VSSYLVGLLGEGITRSLTPPMHEQEGRRLGLDYEYRILDLREMHEGPGDIEVILRRAAADGFSALNVTHPCKQLVIPLLDELSPEAARLEAVNLILFRDGRRIGHNTDWTGFRSAVEAGLEGARHDRIVQLGAGGAGAATAYAALTLGARELVLVDELAGRAETVAEKYRAWFPGQHIVAAAPGDLPARLGAADGVVNATPIGMAHHPGVSFDVALLNPGAWVADIVYLPLRTELLQVAASRGHRTLDGGLMAVGQAVDSLRLITGREPDAQRMRAHFLDLVGDAPALEEV
jgi:shikimate dehydrogenase